MSNRLNNILLTSEVAHALGCSEQTVRALERSGRLPAQRTTKGVRLFDEADVARVAEARQRSIADIAERRSHESAATALEGR
jgi:excisionase family DNA binding protein